MHTFQATIDLLHQTFDDHFISRNVEANWSPRNCNLAPLYYFVQDDDKEVYYADKLETIKHLKANTRDTIDEIGHHTLEKVH